MGILGMASKERRTVKVHLSCSGTWRGAWGLFLQGEGGKRAHLLVDFGAVLLPAGPTGSSAGFPACARGRAPRGDTA